ncbi:MAG: sensor histidine kinase [Saprospiraceae bacterium]|nr:sensor histidine kinase [Lewinella sp.]
MGDTQTVDNSLSLILLGVIGMLVLAVAVIFFFVIYQRRLFAQQEKMRDMETAYQKDLLESSIKAQEVERRRVATDLHDGVGSLLSAIRLYVLQLSPERSADDYAEILSETKSVVDTAITQTREISHNLLPTTLDRFGVIQAMEDHCKRIDKLNDDMEVHFACDKEYQFNEQQNLALYRILQELINNTLKHAQATSIDVAFVTRGNDIHFTYQDNGKGMDQNEIKALSNGLGLKSIESRVNLLRGKMNIWSEKGKGFRFEIELPAD